jgi:hypothetical protein
MHKQWMMIAAAIGGFLAMTNSGPAAATTCASGDYCYYYVGNGFTELSGDLKYSSANHISVALELNQPINPNGPLTDYTADLVSWSISDGVLWAGPQGFLDTHFGGDPTNLSSYNPVSNVSLDVQLGGTTYQGYNVVSINDWNVFLSFGGVSILTRNLEGTGIDFSGDNGNRDVPGLFDLSCADFPAISCTSWFDTAPGAQVNPVDPGLDFLASVTPTAVPEPLTLSLFSAGLAGAVAMRRRKKAQKA